MSKYILALLAITIAIIWLFRHNLETVTRNSNKYLIKVTVPVTIRDKASSSQTVELLSPPESKILATDYHVFQTFNNCGPAALSMTLRFYGINVSQQELGNELRPWQNSQGINDDKSVTLEELGEKAKDYDLIPYHRPNGNIELIKKFITYDIPVLTRTWTKIDEDIGHYRVVKGYNEQTKQLIQDDSLQDKNLWYSYADFNEVWQKFNYEYLVLVPNDKQEIAKAILGEEKDETIAWQNAAENAQYYLEQNPNDIYMRFNLSVALYEIGDYQRSVEEFEKIEGQLPFRTLWYQIEPIQAYYELGNYNRVFQLTDKILSNQNLAFSELYHLRGQTYLKLGNPESARIEMEKAVYFNWNFKPAKETLLKL